MKENAFLFENTDLPLNERVKDLVSHFTLDEKIELMCQYQPAVERLGVKAYKHGTEAAHGMAWLGEATTFPQPIGLACTWNPELMKEIGSIIGDEARAYYKKNPEVNGLTLWTPTVDMERDPRWGRTEEAYGEDPTLTGELTSALVQGIQGDHPVYYKAIATLKHFIGNNNEVDRGSCSASIDPRNMKEYYLNAFKPAFVKGGAKSMMTAYNSINGTPALLHTDVNKVVKQEWGMNGFIVSDAGDVLGIVQDHKYYDNYEEALAHTIKSGIDSITDDAVVSTKAIRDALAKALLTEEDLNHALENTFRVRFMLGEFDSDELNPYASIPESVLCLPEHSALSLKAAKESIVLLKNDNHALPLDKNKQQKIAVIGPLGNEVHMDWYSGTPPYRVTPLEGIVNKAKGASVQFVEAYDLISLSSLSENKWIGAVTPEDELAANQEDQGEATTFELTDWGWGNSTLKSRSTGKFVTLLDNNHMTPSADYARGWFVKEQYSLDPQEDGQCALRTWEGKLVTVSDQKLLATDSTEVTANEKFKLQIELDGISEAVKAAKASDVAIVFVGNSPFINGKEVIDRPDITLPPAQEKLIQEVYKANPNTIVVIIGSYPFAINWANEHVPAIVYSSHSGQELGNAIADVLFGDYNPAGRLNMTWYQSVDQLADFMDYDIIKGKRTYQYFDGEVLYPFGHGLTYAEFTYSNLKLSASEITADGQVLVTVDVKNTGDRASDEVVQLYVHAEASRVKRPLKQLKGFQRISLALGEVQTVSFELPVEELAFWDVTRDQWCVETGEYLLMIGRSSADIKVQGSLKVEGEVVPPRDLTLVTRAENYDDYQGVILDESKEGGTCISDMKHGDWVLFSDVDFAEGVKGFEARISSESTGGTIEIRLGSPEGELVGTCSFAATGNWQSWETAPCDIVGAQGRCEVYLVMTEAMKLSWFKFNR